MLGLHRRPHSVPGLPLRRLRLGRVHLPPLHSAAARLFRRLEGMLRRQRLSCQALVLVRLRQLQPLLDLEVLARLAHRRHLHLRRARSLSVRVLQLLRLPVPLRRRLELRLRPLALEEAQPRALVPQRRTRLEGAVTL